MKRTIATIGYEGATIEKFVAMLSHWKKMLQTQSRLRGRWRAAQSLIGRI